MKNFTKAFLAVGVALLATNGIASANPIPAGSQLSFSGYVDGGPGPISQATSLDFLSLSAQSSPGVAGDIISYGGGYGAFQGLVCGGSCGKIADIANLVVGALSTDPFLFFQGGNNVNPVTFSLTSIDVINRTDPTSLGITASGTLGYFGYDLTPAQLILTTQAGGKVSFSATTDAQAVPEPATLLLLGASLLGVVALRRRSTASAAAL